jgi:hypothetical protein
MSILPGCRFPSHDVKQRYNSALSSAHSRASGNPGPRIRNVALGPRYPGPHENRRPQQRSEDRLASAIFVGARRGDERMLRSSRPFHFPALSNHHSPNTFPLRGPLPRFSSLSSARPDEGVGGAPIRRIQRSRLRGASDHAYEACIAPIPNRCARLSALRLAVSAAGAALPWSPATATGQSPRGSSPPGRKLRGSAPRASSCRDFSPWLRRTPSSLRLQESPLERAPSMSEDDGHLYQVRCVVKENISHCSRKSA